MWDSLKTENFNSDVDDCKKLDEQDEPWFKSIINTVVRYKNEIFGGETKSTTHIKKQRMLDYTVPLNYKFVFARYNDGLFRPASIMGRSKKLQLFIVIFYHNRKCCYIKRKDILLKHGNLLEKRVYFCHEGLKKKGKVYGNNSPANNGFPSMFFVKNRDRWYRVSFKAIFLTKKQVNRFYFVSPNKRSSNSLCKSKSDIVQHSLFA